MYILKKLTNHSRIYFSYLIVIGCRDKCKARIRLEIRIEIGLDFDQSKQSSLNLRLIFFLLIGKIPIQSQL